MHELGITQQIVKLAVEHAQQHQAEKITDLYLVIGELSSVIDESVQFYWDIVAKDTLCEGAKLHFKRLPAELHCLDCDSHYHLDQGELTACPQCGSTRIEVSQGKEFQLQSIDIE